jgi:pyruvate,orthophosphate dikinase
MTQPMITQDFYLVAAGKPMAPGGAAEVGNKAWNLMQMAQIGLPVPPAFVLPTSLCAKLSAGQDLPLDGLIGRGLRDVEMLSKKSFGGLRRPLLLSVRSGAAASMPGMMETVLNVGMNDDSVGAMLRASGDPALAWDCYRRLILSYGGVVAGLPDEAFAEVTARLLERHRAKDLTALSFEGLRDLVRALLACYGEEAGEAFPQDVQEQLRQAVKAVFASWNGEKAKTYRRLHGLDDLAGTAVTVQAMVFGNMGGFSGSGVGFTRDPSDGGDRLYLDFLFNGQGEDIVAGRHRIGQSQRLAAMMPEVWRQLQEVRRQLEQHFGDAQDFEFTVEEGRLWLLQTRRAKRTPWAALQIALDLCDQGVIGRDAALAALADLDLAAIERRRLANPELVRRLGSAVVASLGVASGCAAFDVETARQLAAEGMPVILIRRDTTTDDIEAMTLAEGILTAAGGRTSHAAVVARQLNKVCLVSCAALEIDPGGEGGRIGAQIIRPKDWLTLDGNDGTIYADRAQFVIERPEAALTRLNALRLKAAG